MPNAIKRYACHGKIIRSLRKRKAWTQMELADAAHITLRTLQDIERGKRCAKFQTLKKIARALDISAQELTLYFQQNSIPAEQKTEPYLISEKYLYEDLHSDFPWQPDITTTLIWHITKNDLMMDRRTAIKTMTATVLNGVSLFEALEGWFLPCSDQTACHQKVRGQLGQQDLEPLKLATRAFRNWDHQFSGALRRKAVIGLLNEVTALQQEGQPPALEHQLYCIMADLAGIAAGIAWDSGLQHQAQNYYRLALRSAHAGGDQAFGANILAGMARQMLYLGYHSDALELVRIAQQSSHHVAGAKLKSMLYTREAWAMAALGRVAGFERATALAHEALAEEKQDDEPYWIEYFNEAELAGVTGGRLLDLARHNPKRYAEQASLEIGKAVRARGAETGRGHALDHIGLAECRFLMGDMERAVHHTEKAIQVFQTVPSGRVRSSLKKLHHYTIQQEASRQVSEMHDRLENILYHA